MASEEKIVREKEYREKETIQLKQAIISKSNVSFIEKKIVANSCSCIITAYYDNLVLINMK